jgi:hypothetical protein
METPMLGTCCWEDHAYQWTLCCTSYVTAMFHGMLPPLLLRLLQERAPVGVN